MRMLLLSIVVALMGSGCFGITCAWDDIGEGPSPSPPGGQYAPIIGDWSLQWSPDGQSVVVNILRELYNPGVYVVSLQEHSLRRLFVNPDGAQALPSIAHDGRIAYEEYTYVP